MFPCLNDLIETRASTDQCTRYTYVFLYSTYDILPFYDDISCAACLSYVDRR